jgi:hypothetical protein
MGQEVETNPASLALPMALVLDTIHDYRQSLPAVSGNAECRLRIYRQGEEYLVMLSDTKATGVSITNWFDDIAWPIYCELGKPSACTFIEYYPPTSKSYRTGEEFSIVTFPTLDTYGRFDDALWKQVSFAEIEALIGVPLAEEASPSRDQHYCPVCDKAHNDAPGIHNGRHEQAIVGSSHDAVDRRAEGLARERYKYSKDMLIHFIAAYFVGNRQAGSKGRNC